MKNKLLVMGLAAVFAMTGMTSAQNLLLNGDFALEGAAPNLAASWDQWGGNFNNREAAPADFAPNLSYVVSLGGWDGNVSAGISQTVEGAVAGEWYKLQADSVIEAWWNLEGYLQIEFLDVSDNVLATEVSAHWNAPGDDAGLAPDNYSMYRLAPAGTDAIVATLGGIGPGGTVRFDNAALQIVPEPATLGLLGLSGLALWIVRRRI